MRKLSCDALRGEGRKPAALRTFHRATLVAAHELRNCLHALAFGVDHLRREEPVDGRHEETLRMMSTRLTDASRLVEDLLAGDLMAGSFKVSRQSCDLVLLLDRAVEDERAWVGSHGHALLWSACPSPLIVSIDPMRVHQVLRNLLQNAVELSDPPGKIEVRVAAEDGFATVEVQDHGAGMGEAALRRLFTTGRGGSRGGGAGKGLGLFVCRRILEAHGGTLEAESAGPGLGATFRFRIPLAT